MSYLIDTNILIKYYAEELPANVMDFVERVLEESFNISFINRIEVLGYHGLSADQIQQLEESFGNSNEYKIDDDLITVAIRIARSYNFKAADSIIAATAINNDLILISNDERFRRANPELRLVDPLRELPHEE